MGALKDIYSPSFFNTFSDALEGILPTFDRRKFSKEIFSAEWKNKELKERMKHTTFVLHQFLPDDFNKAATLIEKLTLTLQQTEINENLFGFMFLPDYIETYGLNNFDTSVRAIELVTPFASCEYAVRPFIIKYKDDMMKKMLDWSNHKNHHVRRLASEGSRPRLPWAMALPELKRNPKPILPILENLKTDSSEYVRRSVANSLNDITKDNPNIVISIAKKWKGSGKNTQAIIKHGCRTLLKQGHPEVLKFYKLSDSKEIQVANFKVLTPKVKIGNRLEFSFELLNNESKTQTVRLEYAIHYLRQNGQLSKKVFKISERMINPKEKILFNKSQSFKIITTRKFYTGQQKLSIIVNGQERKIGKFELT